MTMRHPNRPFFLLLSTFFVLAVIYSIAIPLFEGPDEDDHFRYAKYLADHRALPVQLFQAGGGEAGHQGWQPPLYYALAALVISPVDTSDFEKHLQRNPLVSFQGDRACCGRNLYFHTRSEDFPYTRTTLAVHLARGVSILFGVLAVACIYALVLTLFPGRKWLALAAAAVAGFNPSFLYASALVSNDIPLAALCTLALLLLAKLLMNQLEPNLEHFAWVGLVIALALLVKSTALGLIPFALAAGAFIALRQDIPAASAGRSFFSLATLRKLLAARILWKALVGVLAPGLVLTSWWFVRNQILYGDPMAYRLLYASAMFPREQPLTWPELWNISLPWLWQTFWGGPTPGDFSPPLLIILGVLTALGLIGSVVAFLRQRDFSVRAVLILLAGWLAFILVAQLQFMRTSGGTDQGRYLFPAIASFAILFVFGQIEITERTSAWAGSRVGTHSAHRPTHSLTHILSFTLILVPVLLAIYVLVANTLPAYARPPQSDETILSRADQKLDANFSNQLALRGYALSARSLGRGEMLNVNLYWQGLVSMRRSYRVFVHLVDQNGRVAGGTDVVPYHGSYATVLWQPGEWVADSVSFPVNNNARAGTYQIEVGLYPAEQPDNRLNLVNSDQDRVLLDAIEVRE